MLMMDHFEISEVEIYFIETVNNLCLLYFVVEIAIKLIGIYYFFLLFDIFKFLIITGMDLKTFVKDKFNIFDTVITTCSLLEIVIGSIILASKHNNSN